MIAMQVRLLEPADREHWMPLWAAYLDASGRELPARVADLTWSRFHDPAEPMAAIGAVDDDGTMLGFAHLVFHRSCWQENGTSYLEDLFVASGSRGRGVGRALVDAAIAHARDRGAARVYWITHQDNGTARRLYDSITPASGFIHYRVKLAG